ncbi:hypothetical protein N8920_02125 [Opitutales bacterium]|nr:hypothetical protein [Opitutales bacterium]
MVQIKGDHNFERRDAHPKIKGLFFLRYEQSRTIQRWVEEERLKPLHPTNHIITKALPKDIPIHNSGKALGRINQTLLQTGKEQGFYNIGDLHPIYKNCFYLRWNGRVRAKNSEMWGSSDQLNKIKSRARKRHVKRWNVDKGRPTMAEKSYQTGSSIKFKRGDQHPSRKLVFKSYKKDKKQNKVYEIWVTAGDLHAWKQKRKDFPSRQARPSTPRERKQNRERAKKKRDNDPQYRLASVLRVLVRTSLSVRKASKAERTKELLGSSIEQFKVHLESQFTEGMSWNNMGRGGWHIDHIIPCAFFDLTKPSHQKVCFNWQNLQPLWEKDNITKGDKFPLSVLLVLFKYGYNRITV